MVGSAVYEVYEHNIIFILLNMSHNANYDIFAVW